MSIDVWAHVTYLNTVAETLTGWTREEAAGRPLAEVFSVIDSTSRQPVQKSHAARDSAEQNRRPHSELRPGAAGRL
jgi:PAS domain S-box-containing protein